MAKKWYVDLKFHEKINRLLENAQWIQEKGKKGGTNE